MRTNFWPLGDAVFRSGRVATVIFVLGLSFGFLTRAALADAIPASLAQLKISETLSRLTEVGRGPLSESFALAEASTASTDVKRDAIEQRVVQARPSDAGPNPGEGDRGAYSAVLAYGLVSLLSFGVVASVLLLRLMKENAAAVLRRRNAQLRPRRNGGDSKLSIQATSGGASFGFFEPGIRGTTFKFLKGRDSLVSGNPSRLRIGVTAVPTAAAQRSRIFIQRPWQYLWRPPQR